MRSVKPGRGPSMMGGIASLGAAVFGIFWTIMAASVGAPFPIVIFGLFFVGMGIMSAVYNFKNATGKNRYSEYDVTDGNEEPDPLNERFGEKRTERERPAQAAHFCPYCGAALKEGYEFCPNCGKRIV